MIKPSQFLQTFFQQRISLNPNIFRKPASAKRFNGQWSYQKKIKK